MKAIGITLQILFLCLLLLHLGCEMAPGTNNTFDTSIYGHYAPAKIEIMPLTEFITATDTEDSKIKVYLSVLDSTDCQTKTPAVFRFELYEYVKLSAEPKGRRVAIWPDVDLVAPEDNNQYWRDFLRVYVFDLDFEPEDDGEYILQITCLSPNGKRLTTDFNL